MGYRIQTLKQLHPLAQRFRRMSGLNEAAKLELQGVTQQTYAKLDQIYQA
jgi:hypothetical protein